MAQKWNLQDIRPAGPAQKPAPRTTLPSRPQQDISYKPRPEPRQPSYATDPDLATIDIIDGNGVKKKRVIITMIIALIIVVLGYFMNVMLAGADVTVHPKTKSISVQAEFTAYEKPQAGQLGYELLTLEATGEKQVKASGKETVSEKAQGKLFIYNANTASQRLIKNTRFETKDGLIFRIKDSVEVPPAKKDDKGVLTPGSIAADVIADGAGEQYNIPPSRFTVPGLKGTDQYETVYGESTAAFTGGFEGEKYLIDEGELQTAQQALHVELRQTLLERLKTERPAGFVVYDDAVTLTFTSLPSTEYGESVANISEKAFLKVPIFKEDDFARFLAESTIPDYNGQPVTVTSPENITFSYINPTTTVSDIAGLTALDFTLKGSSQVVWTFDEEELKSKLIGKKKAEATQVFSSYGAIGNAQAVVRPFWATSFPEKPEKITIHTQIEESKSN